MKKKLEVITKYNKKHCCGKKSKNKEKSYIFIYKGMAFQSDNLS